ncbi:MAG: hypothetical protein KDK91_28415, partial [Gammaproteobacteria bacterium]|nr:hypothetical protein [Gammaproteobacteria bacterium]
MSGTTDARGHALSTGSATAADAFNAGVDSFVRWRTDAIARMDAAIEADPSFAMARLGKGWILQTARSASYRPVIERLLAESAPHLGTDPRERAYFDALGLACQGHGVAAATILETMLQRYPTDLFAHRLTQFELFWNGRSDWMCDIAERATPHWNESTPGYGSFQSVRAFSNEEAGHYALAEQCGRTAVEMDPHDVWGTHAVAHVLVMQGEIERGVSWLEGLCGNWEGINQMAHHLWWHLALFLLERGEHVRILQLLTERIRNPQSPLVQALPDATIDIQNVASLLLRLELRGVDVGDAWS